MLMNTWSSNRPLYLLKNSDILTNIYITIHNKLITLSTFFVTATYFGRRTHQTGTQLDVLLNIVLIFCNPWTLNRPIFNCDMLLFECPQHLPQLLSFWVQPMKKLWSTKLRNAEWSPFQSWWVVLWHLQSSQHLLLHI